MHVVDDHFRGAGIACGGAQAAGKVDLIEQDWRHLPKQHHMYAVIMGADGGRAVFVLAAGGSAVTHNVTVLDGSGGLEAIIQTHLFAGFPRTLNALAAVHRVGVNVEEIPREPRDDLRTDWRRRGESLCSEVYGPSYTKLRAKTKELHPDFDLWMVETGYGRVMSRPGLTRRMRELCVIAALMGQNVPPQLVRYEDGCARAGFVTCARSDADCVLGSGSTGWWWC